jgi:hypothetical protein
MKDLIYTRRNSLPKDFCDFVINKFETSTDNQMEGLSGDGVQVQIKKSTDLMLTNFLDDPDWSYIYSYLSEELLQSLVEYNENTPWIWRRQGDFSSKLSLVRSVQNRFTASSNGNHHMQMQRYIGDEGYYAWHFENYLEYDLMRNRQMAFMWYLNDLESGGETEFKFQKTKVKPEAGKSVIFPAFWTHTHRGNPPSGNQRKYIITGWIEQNTEEENASNEFSEDFFV